MPATANRSSETDTTETKIERQLLPIPSKSTETLQNTAQAARNNGDLSFIVHSHLRWDFVWQRPQQIFSRLARTSPVLFLEDPVFGGTDNGLRFTEPSPNIIRAVPYISSNMELDQAYLQTLVWLNAALRDEPRLAGGFDTPVQWFYSPMSAPHMLGQFNARQVVYDCMDELANFRFASSALTERERMLLSAADIVFTGGYQLFEAKSRLHRDVHFFGCGVDVAHFGRARDDDLALPPEVGNLPHPRFGYFGVIDERLDYELLRQLALAHPQASIIMIGPLAKVEAHELPMLPNIHWLGQRPYETLPAFVKSFDVCLMPFALNDATRYINPTKTLEYMAAGKPIVSTAVPDVVRNFAPIVEVANTPGEFVQVVVRAYREPNVDRIAQGIDKASQASWDAIVRSMRDHIVSRTSKQPASSHGRGIA